MLTVKQVLAALPRAKPYRVADGAGLYLQVQPSGAKYWRHNCLIAGKAATLSYGVFPEVTLAAARTAHIAAKAVLADGGDPRIARGGRDRRHEFETVAREWHERCEPRWTTKHAAQVLENLERFVFARIGQRDIRTIKRTDLVGIMQAMDALDISETSHRVAQRIGAVFDYAVDLGLIDSSPAVRLARVLSARPERQSFAAVSPADVPLLMAAIKAYPGDDVTRIGLQLLAHTFVRTSELRGMRWTELVTADIWVVPGERMKVKRPHVVPLSQQAQALLAGLREVTGQSEYVLATYDNPLRPISNNAMLFALYRMGCRGRMTGHGFRAIASSVLNEEGFSRDAVERQLAHAETDEVRAAYHRAEYLPERRKMMQWWSDWLESGGGGAKVLSVKSTDVDANKTA